MRKLLCKLQYSIDVGIDFLVRNIDDDGYFCGEHDLSRHLLATCCLSEHLGKDERLMKPLSVVSSFSYYDNGRIFLSDEHLNSLAAISFLSCGRNDFGIGYLKSIKNNSAQDVEAFVVAFEKTEDKKWLDKAEMVTGQLQDSNDFWSTIAAEHYCRHRPDEKLKTFVKKAPWNIEDENELKAFAYNRIEKQDCSPAPDRCGGFFDENGVRLDWSHENITILKKILSRQEEKNKTKKI